MRRRQAAGIGGALLTILVALVTHWAGTTATPPTRAPGPGAGPAVAGSAPTDPSRGFRSRERLAEHFAKHGREFGQIPIGEYLRRAQALRDRPAGDGLLEHRRADGVVTRFDRRTGAFGAFDPDGVIRTFFRPDDGEAYFRRQAGREEP